MISGVRSECSALAKAQLKNETHEIDNVHVQAKTMIAPLLQGGVRRRHGWRAKAAAPNRRGRTASHAALAAALHASLTEM